METEMTLICSKAALKHDKENVLQHHLYEFTYTDEEGMKHLLKLTYVNPEEFVLGAEYQMTLVAK